MKKLITKFFDPFLDFSLTNSSTIFKKYIYLFSIYSGQFRLKFKNPNLT